MLMRTRRILSLASVLVVGGVVAVVLPHADASVPHAAIVKDNPADFTPNLQDDANVANAATYAFSQLGGTMYAGGAFRVVKNAARTATYTRYNLMAFSAANGAMASFAPNLNGPVWSIASTGSSLYAAGEFTTVNGVARRGIVKLNAGTGAVDTAFNAKLASGKATEVKIVGGRVLIGGTFPKQLLALNAATGANTNYINLPVTGTVASNAGPTGIYRFAVNSAGNRLVAIGNFTAVGGATRYRAVQLSLNAASAALNPWNYTPLQRMCAATSAPEYLRDVDFAPDGKYFVLVATGGIPASTTHIGTSVCDGAARFETNTASPAKPTWINYTGGDTLHSVAATGSAVYVQGHQRWLDNPNGRNNAGPGAVSRPGIGAINPSTGKALAWNPGKEGGVGGKDLYATSAGLWVGSDTRYFKGEYRESIALCPL